MKVDFTVMGVDEKTSQYLNWALSERNNLEFVMECKYLEKPSSHFTVHLDHMRIIQKIDIFRKGDLTRLP